MSLDMEAVEFLKRKQCAKCGGSGQVAVTGFITHSSGRCESVFDKPMRCIDFPRRRSGRSFAAQHLPESQKQWPNNGVNRGR